MFTKNTTHRQRDLFDDMLSSLPEVKRKKAEKSKETAFYNEVFSKIDESLFAPLFAGERGRPNAPVNAMVAALILREVRRWTYEELFERMDFDILTRLALGLTNLSDSPFCPATLFNFQQRLLTHEQETGENLFERIFQLLTAKQIRRLGLRTDIQRCDSFRAMSNIANYSRARLLVEVLLRLVRILDEEDRKRFADILAAYTGQSSDNFIYRLDNAEVPRELKKLGDLYAQLADGLGKKYAIVPVFQMFLRVFSEQFEITNEDSVRVRDRTELSSGILQSPDDPDATFNAKGGKPQKGHKVNVVETASPENTINLITDVSVAANNVPDGSMLAEQVDQLKERTPDLNEMHTDGAYGGKDLNPKMSEHKILHVETGTKMGKARVNMRYESQPAGGWEISCPNQTVPAQRTPKQWKAVFRGEVCRTCPHADECPSRQRGEKCTFYFKQNWAESYARSRNLEKIPESRRKLRANVEATMKEFTGCFNHKGKLRVRGRTRTALQMLAAAIAINFGRIFRLQNVPENREAAELSVFSLPGNGKIEKQTIFSLLNLVVPDFGHCLAVRMRASWTICVGFC